MGLTLSELHTIMFSVKTYTQYGFYRINLPIESNDNSIAHEK